MVHKVSVASDGYASQPLHARKTRPRLARSTDAQVESPAAVLQQTVAAGVASAETKGWSPRRTLAFLVVVNGAGWLGLAAVLKAVF